MNQSGQYVIRFVKLCLVCTTLLETPASAFFCPKRPADPAKAQELGRKMWSIAAVYYRQGAYRQAMEAWLCSSRLYPKPPPTAFFNAGRAAERAGLTEKAVQHYREYLRRRPAAPERSQIESTLKRLTRQIAQRPAIQPRRPATRPRHIDIKPERRRVDSPRPGVTPTPRTKRSKRSRLALGGYISLGVGSVLAIVAATFSGLYWEAKNSVENPDDAYWNPTVKQAYDRYAGYRSAAWTCAAIAGAALVTGTVLLVLDRRRHAERRVSVVPSLGPNGPAFTLNGRF